jgi:linearmycin/streptolysin S transport system permease protein
VSVLSAIVRKDLQLFRTDRRAVLMQIVAPVVISAFFGFVFSRGSGDDGPRGRIAVLAADEDGSPVSRALVDGLAADPALDVQPSTAARAGDDVRRGRAAVAVVLPAGFGAAAEAALVRGGARPEIGLLHDPSRTAEVALVRGLLTQQAMRAVAEGAFPAARQAPRLPFELRAQAMTARRDVAYDGFAHAFAGMSVQFILFAGINLGVGLLMDKQRGVWKRLRAAPLSKAFVLGARAASGALIAFLTLSIVFAVAVGVFGVRIRGSLFGFVAVLAAIAIMASTFGLLVATLGRTPEATRGLSGFAVLIMVMLGGAWVPSFVFPAWLQKATLVVPARWAVDGIEAVTWRGLPFSAVLPHLFALLGFSALFVAVAALRFRWEAD